MTVKDVRKECDEDKGTDCKNGDSDNDWYKQTESDKLCAVSV